MTEYQALTFRHTYRTVIYSIY